MFFSTIALTSVAVLSSIATAAPTTAAPTSDLTRRDADSCKYTVLEAAAHNSEFGPYWYAWTVVIPDDKSYEKGGCGQGFSDNFGGECSEGSDSYNSFNCDTAPDGTATMTFLASNTCTGPKITRAINMASGGKLNTDCTGPPLP